MTRYEWPHTAHSRWKLCVKFKILCMWQHVVGHTSLSQNDVQALQMELSTWTII